MQKLTIKIERNISGKIFWQEYNLDFKANKSLFWWLKKIQDELDSTLAFECSCNAGLCGACAVRANDKAVLSCKELIKTADTLMVRPLATLPTVKDLVIDWRRVEQSLRAHQQWLFAKYQPLSAEYTLDVAESKRDKELASCIACGICVSVCPVLPKGGFAYPYLFCKGQRMLLDKNVPLQLQGTVRADLSTRAARCVACGACDRSCPKGVRPSESVGVFL